MGTFGIKRSRDRLGFAPSTAVRSGQVATDVGSGAAIGQALVGVGQMVVKLKAKADKQNADIEMSEFESQVKIDNVARGAEISAELDESKHPAIYKKWAEKRQAMTPTSKLNATRATIFNNNQDALDEVSLIGGQLKRSNDNWDTQTSIKIAELEGSGNPDSFASVNKWIADRQENKPMPLSKVTALLATAKAAYAKGSVESLKPAVEQTLMKSGYNTKTALETIDTGVAELQKKGVLSDVGAAEARRELSNWSADIAAQRRKAEKSSVIQIQKGLADKLATGKFTGDDITLSGMTQAQRKNGGWDKIAEGNRKPEPARSTYSGTKTATQAALDYATGDIGELEARKILMTERYVNGALTDSHYSFLLGKIENKYPDDIAKVVGGALESAKTVLHQKGAGLFFKDWVDSKEKKKLTEVNNGLLSWLDIESKDGKYPSGEEIYKKVRELGISVEVPDSAIPIALKPIPKKTDPLYDPNDADFEALPAGSQWYDPKTGMWWTKNE